MAHKKKPKGKKAEMVQDLLDLLREKGKGASKESTAASMLRLTAAAAAARVVNDRPLAIAHTAPLLLTGPGEETTA